MKKILNILKYKLGWQTYKDAFFWTFVSIWLFVDVVTFSCIYYNPNIDWEWTMHLINLGFIWFIAICTFIKERGGKFNDWLNTKFEKQNMKTTYKILETKYFKKFIQDCSEDAWQKYLDAIDKEIDFIKEWERSIEDRNKSK